MSLWCTNVKQNPGWNCPLREAISQVWMFMAVNISMQSSYLQLYNFVNNILIPLINLDKENIKLIGNNCIKENLAYIDIY